MMSQKELESKIKYYQDLYYSGSGAEISDAEFDELWDELATNYPNSEVLTRVGDSASSGENKFKHTIHMGSQAKINSYDGIQDWLRLKSIKFPILIEEKIDGLSCELIYENGSLIQALTRGDGIYGKSIIDNVKLMNVPKAIPYNTGTVYVRGEIVLPTNNIAKLKGFDEIKNPRNIASGIANQKDSKVNLNLLEIICYDVFSNANENSKIAFLYDNGFKIPVFHDYAYSYNDIIKLIEKIKTYKDSNNFGYQIDGVVLKQNIRPQNADLTKARPDWQRAYKYAVDEYTTTLIDIEWSRNGYNFTPVALFNPIEIDGTTVSRASLSNIGEIKRLGIKLPCKVDIAKQNEIIPKVHKVVELLENSIEPEPPKVCPICGEALIITDTSIQCVNPLCASRSEHRFAKWFESIGALGFGEALVKYLTYDCHLEHISELYCNDVISKIIDKYASPKNAQKAFADLWAKSKNIELYNFLAGFDLGGLGAKVIKLVTDAGYNTFDLIRKVNYDDLINIPGFAKFRAEVFLKQIKLFQNEMEAVLNTNRVTIKSPVVNLNNIEQKANNLETLTFCITGKLTAPRKEYESLITSKGHKLSDKVSKNTSYLVNNDINSASSKNQDAKKLGIPIIDEKEFLRIING